MKAFIQWLSHESKTSEEDENSSAANDEHSLHIILISIVKYSDN
jgi:hypothetical protein